MTSPPFSDAPYSAYPVESGPRCFIDWSIRVISSPIGWTAPSR